MVIPFACHCKNNKICDSFLPLVSYPNERHFRNYRFPIIKNSLSERRFFRMTWRLIFGRSLSIITPSVQFSRSVVSDSLRPHWLQYASPPSLMSVASLGPWTSRSNQLILKEVNPEYSLERLMLKLKLKHFGHLMQRPDSLEKTLMLGKTQSGRRRGRQRTG